MGQAAIEREYRLRPPREELTSISALWRDYKWRYVKAKRQDPCVYWTEKAPNLDEAIRRAVESRGEDGKMFFHQSKVTQNARDRYAQLLRRVEHYDWIKEALEDKHFWEMMLALRNAADSVPGIGEVTVYDVASRLGAWAGVEPEHLWFHAGVKMGLKALRVPIPRNVYCIDRERLPKFFHDKNLDEVESFLCGYRSEIERVMALKDKRKKKKGRRRGRIR